jgi:hypothetical protein
MKYLASFKSLCLPSKVYFVLSLFGIVMSFFYAFDFGGASLFMQTIHFIYVVFWTWVLNLICNAGYNWLSWLLVLAPFLVILFVFAFAMNDAFRKVNQENTVYLV